jgi:hypothetical protein
VKAGSAVRNVVYGDKKLTYTGVAAGQDVLLLPSKPLKIAVSGQDMAASNWDYQPALTTLSVKRPLGDVEIRW